ncbi:MAG: NAD(P)H-dependent oxidoreductase [Candidatus Gracilibacteria bacterium]|nr:NAD(P)H-dependent oxidoreductase [Candidatus Gracilibacteria bacterium]
MSFLNNLEWRYATKKFDTSRKVSSENLDTILEAIRMTPTSFGLQPYHFYVVNRPDVMMKIQEASWNQPQVGTASHIIVMCARNDLMQTKDEYFDAMSGGKAEIRASLAGFEQMVTGFIPNSSPEWAKKQAYIAQGFALAACAELQIDSCPMEGFDPVAVGQILSLPENLSVAVIIPIGYRALDENPRSKVRFPKEKLFTFITE